jgi:aspartate carbamoyltransferase catalytic subunit
MVSLFIFQFVPLVDIQCPIEIDPEVDFDSRRAVYFRQMRYGLFVSSSCRVFDSLLIEK